MHYSVLKNEVIDALNIKDDGVYVDATLGYAGDSKEILKRIKKGYLFAFDKDIEAINYSRKELSKISNQFQIIQADFVEIPKYLKDKKIDGFLFDLGVSSPQLDQDRGFSFMRDEKLDMRMDRDNPFDASIVVNSYSEKQLLDIFYKYGEEKKSSYIAKGIVEARREKKIETTFQLCDIIKSSVGANYYYKTHPERNIFQAIRIEVNHELQSIENVLPELIPLLNKGGRIVVITFHSLEDRIVKSFFKKYSTVDRLLSGEKDIPEEYAPKLTIINKKPILPSDKELSENSRSKSAKLRIAERR